MASASTASSDHIKIEDSSEPQVLAAEPTTLPVELPAPIKTRDPGQLSETMLRSFQEDESPMRRCCWEEVAKGHSSYIPAYVQLSSRSAKPCWMVPVHVLGWREVREAFQMAAVRYIHM
jgi:hypothetical protein